MTKTATIVCLLGLMSATAEADRLELLDGRTFQGIVVMEEGTATIQMAYGTLRFGEKDIRQIIFEDTPRQKFTKKLAETPPDDAKAMFTLAQWAQANGLKSQAEETLKKIIALDSDHADARRQLGFARIGDRWLSFDETAELARSKLQAGRYDDVLNDIVPTLSELPLQPDRKTILQDILAQAQLRAGKFAKARETFAALAENTDAAVAFRYSAIVRILGNCTDGMYVLAEDYPPGGVLTGEHRASVKAGPASLAQPLVLQGALWEMARRQIDAGKKTLAEAKTAETLRPGITRAKYILAEKQFQQADALSPDIARSYHVEIARRRISILRKIVDTDAKKYERIENSLGADKLSPKAERNMIWRMVHSLDNVRDGLKDILTLAKPYNRELILEVRWAQTDLQKIEAMRKILTDDLDNG